MQVAKSDVDDAGFSPPDKADANSEWIAPIVLSLIEAGGFQQERESDEGGEGEGETEEIDEGRSLTRFSHPRVQCT